MKKSIHSRAFALLMTCMMLASAAQAADYYVVIGTFAEEANARRYARNMSHVFKDVFYSFNHERKLYYVHVFKTSHKEDAQNQLLRVKREKGLRDVWVYTDPGGMVNEDSYRVGGTSQGHPRRERAGSVQRGFKEAAPVIASSAGGGKFLSYTDKGSAGAAASLTWTSKWGVSYISSVKEPARLVNTEALANNLFTFIVEDPQGKEIQSEVMLVDFEKASRIASFHTREYAAIRGTRREQLVALVCDVMGYAQETRMYNIDHLSRGRDIRRNKDGVWEVRFRLQKMEINDVAPLSKTSFHDGAAVFKHSSEEELQQLVSVMKLNPGYKITIHGHCNPKGKREIRLPRVENGYFDIERAEVKMGSDKQLTKERARAVRNYLIDHGISKKRIDIIGWAGMEPVANPRGREAGMNDRVEFELVEDAGR